MDAYGAVAPMQNHKSSLDDSSTIASITLPMALIEAQSLRSHALCFLIKCAEFLIEPCIFRFRRIAASQFFERFFNGEFSGFSHGNPRSLFWLKRRLTRRSCNWGYRVRVEVLISRKGRTHAGDLPSVPT
jgi:hypothetical protein